jgi:hypothetical protein
MVRIESDKDLTEILGYIGELDKQGRQQAADILLGGITEIKVKKGEGCQSSSTNIPDLFDDC